MTRIPQAPLTPLTMAILLALAEEDQHGYGLMRDVEIQTEGELVPGTGSLYAALQRLVEDGLIMDSPVQPAEGEDRRRKYFRITAAGRSAARAEAARMVRVLETARKRALIRVLPSVRPAR